MGNRVELLVYGRQAMFCDPVTKTAGERVSYQVPTYGALRGVLCSVYWKPTFDWVIDKVRVMKPIKREAQGVRLIRWNDGSADRAYNTYLVDVAYQIVAHLEWSGVYPDDENQAKHILSAKRHISRGGKFDIFLGSRECQAYVEPCKFGEGESAYDNSGTIDFGVMVHGITYPEANHREMLESRLWHCQMTDGIISFPHPRDCPIVRPIKKALPKIFSYHTNEHEEEQVSDLPENALENTVPAPMESQNISMPTNEMTSWEMKLIHTFDRLAAFDVESNGQSKMLYPGHITKNVALELCVDETGKLLPDTIHVVPKDKQPTIISCSLLSQFRTGRTVQPHLLFDKVETMAGDAAEYGGSEDGGHKLYMEQLRDWCTSDVAHPMVLPILAYLEKGTLCKDLVDAGIIPVITIPGAGSTALTKKEWVQTHKEREALPEVYSSEERPMIAFVRINVVDNNGEIHEVWKNRTLYPNVLDYNLKYGRQFLNDHGANVKEGICYVTGQKTTLTDLHPYIMGTNKLISSNQKKGYLYRGYNMSEASDLVTIGYEASQKMHLALRWLIENQSVRIANHTFLIWSENHLALPDIRDSETPHILGDMDSLDENGEAAVIPSFKERLKAYVLGSNESFQGIEDDTTYIMEIAPPSTGRISVLRMESLPTSSYLARINQWFATAYDMLPTKTFLDGKKAPVYRQKLRSLKLIEIASAACGRSKNDQLFYGHLLTLYNSLVSGEPVPYAIVEGCKHNMESDLLTMEARDRSYGIESRVSLKIATAVIRKYLNDLANNQTRMKQYKEIWTMSLDVNSTDRGYLLGRLLAHELHLEQYATWYQKARSNKSIVDLRETNAERLFIQFQRRPATVLAMLSERLIPYEIKCAKTRTGQAIVANRDALVAQIPPEYLTDTKLPDSFYLGFRAQLDTFRNEKKEKRNKEN